MCEKELEERPLLGTVQPLTASRVLMHEHEAKYHISDKSRITTKGHMSAEWYQSRIKELDTELEEKREIIDKMIFDSLGVDDRDRRIQELEAEKKEWLLDGLNRTIKTIFWGGDRNHVTDKIIIDFTDGSTQKRKVGGIL